MSGTGQPGGEIGCGEQAEESRQRRSLKESREQERGTEEIIMEFRHIPVLLSESIDGLDIKPYGIYVDCTAGGAGHSLKIASKLDTGMLIALDRDPDAVKTASERLSGLPAKVIQANYSEISDILKSLGINGADGILMDLGVSSYQLDCRERGFSYNSDAPLDMRMSRSGMSAADFVNTAPQSEISRVLYTYGEEKYAGRIAEKIVCCRKNKRIETTSELADIIRSGVPQKARREKNPCKKTFQAIRIEVNGEFEHLKKGLTEAFRCLNTNGRLAVITFHSLEDRIVKQQFQKWTQGCTCPKEFPVCVCGKKPLAKLINRRPVTASEKELEENRRSHSAKLRVLERTDEAYRSC